MPMYEYKCTRCSRVQSRMMSIAMRDDAQFCDDNDCHGACAREEIPDSVTLHRDKRHETHLIKNDGSKVNVSTKNNKLGWF